MNDTNTTPTRPKPAPETVKTLTPPVWARPSTYTGILALFSFAPQILAIWHPLLSHHQEAVGNAVAGTLVLVTVILEGRRAVDSSGRVAELPGNGGGVVTGQEQ